MHHGYHIIATTISSTTTATMTTSISITPRLRS